MKETPALVSVIIAAYNAEKYIEDAVGSVFAQTYQHFEIIIVDDGSSDSTRKKVEKLAQIDNRVRYLYQSNKGAAAARNYGMRQACGDFFSFLDADDYWVKDKLEVQIEELTINRDCFLYSGSIFIYDNHEKKINPKIIAGKTAKSKEEFIGSLLTKKINPSFLCSVIISKNIVEAVGYFDETLSVGEDIDYWIRIVLKFPFKVMERPLFYRRKHSGNLAEKTSLDQKRENMFKVVANAQQRCPELKLAWDRILATIYLNYCNNYAYQGLHKRAYWALWRSFWQYPMIIFEKKTIRCVLDVILGKRLNH